MLGQVLLLSKSKIYLSLNEIFYKVKKKTNTTNFNCKEEIREVPFST